MKCALSILLLLSSACLVYSGKCEPKPVKPVPVSECIAQCNKQEAVKVCGDDLKTYDSECHMKCTNPEVKRYYWGPCFTSNSCICPDVFDPVCGDDGKVYSNTCAMKCSGVKQQGPCKDDDNILTSSNQGSLPTQI